VRVTRPFDRVSNLFPGECHGFSLLFTPLDQADCRGVLRRGTREKSGCPSSRGLAPPRSGTRATQWSSVARRALERTDSGEAWTSGDGEFMGYFHRDHHPEPVDQNGAVTA
jgi:hypothetical protein